MFTYLTNVTLSDFLNVIGVWTVSVNLIDKLNKLITL